MADIHKFSRQVIDLAERLEDMADAAKGKGRRGTTMTTRFFFLPAAGAALYAFAKSEFVTKQTKGVVNGAKSRASELPSDLLNAVRQTQKTSQNASSSSTGQRSNRSGRKRASRKTTARKTASSSGR
jgi:hypothetical protein